MQKGQLSYRPSLDPDITEQRLSLLLHQGIIGNHSLYSRMERLDRSFRRYASLIPFGLWAPGLVITPQMRAQSELLFPMEELLAVFRQFFALALQFPPFLEASLLHNAPSWPDALHDLEGVAESANPANLLQMLLQDEMKRRAFLFQNFLPSQYGGCFNRYPQQMAFLYDWLRGNRALCKEPLRCLDAACGCGEGTYDLARLLLACGFAPSQLEIHGSTIEPLELFAAAHCFFPHDKKRQAVHRDHVGSLFEWGVADRMLFLQEDILGGTTQGQYHVILCNGIIGGRFLHQQREVDEVVAGFVARLTAGGIVLAADRFHGGWKKKLPTVMLSAAFKKHGLSVLEAGGGLAGIRTG